MMKWKNILKGFRPPKTEEELLQRYKNRKEYGGYVDMEGNWNPYSGPETSVSQSYTMHRGDYISAYGLMVEVLKEEGQATLKRLIEAAEGSTYINSDREIKAILDSSPEIKEENGVYMLKPS